MPAPPYGGVEEFLWLRSPFRIGIYAQPTNGWQRSYTRNGAPWRDAEKRGGFVRGSRHGNALGKIFTVLAMIQVAQYPHRYRENQVADSDVECQASSSCQSESSASGRAVRLRPLIPR